MPGAPQACCCDDPGNTVIMPPPGGGSSWTWNCCTRYPEPEQNSHGGPLYYSCDYPINTTLDIACRSSGSLELRHVQKPATLIYNPLGFRGRTYHGFGEDGYLSIPFMMTHNNRPWRPCPYTAPYAPPACNGANFLQPGTWCNPRACYVPGDAVVYMQQFDPCFDINVDVRYSWIEFRGTGHREFLEGDQLVAAGYLTKWSNMVEEYTQLCVDEYNYRTALYPGDKIHAGIAGGDTQIALTNLYYSTRVPILSVDYMYTGASGPDYSVYLTPFHDSSSSDYYPRRQIPTVVMYIPDHPGGPFIREASNATRGLLFQYTPDPGDPNHPIPASSLSSVRLKFPNDLYPSPTPNVPFLYDAEPIMMANARSGYPGFVQSTENLNGMRLMNSYEFVPRYENVAFNSLLTNWYFSNPWLGITYFMEVPYDEYRVLVNE